MAIEECVYIEYWIGSTVDNGCSSQNGTIADKFVMDWVSHLSTV